MSARLPLIDRSDGAPSEIIRACLKLTTAVLPMRRAANFGQRG
jgi:hypothetical protein